jgi:hypothetical protein
MEILVMAVACLLYGITLSALGKGTLDLAKGGLYTWETIVDLVFITVAWFGGYGLWKLFTYLFG